MLPVQDIFEGDFLDSIGRDYDADTPIAYHYRTAPAQTELDRQLYVDLKLTISDNDLIKVVRSAEWAGITVRFPFLDRRVAEFAATVPASRKMTGRRLRTFFKNAYSDILPQETRSKTKHGFGLPIPVWLRTDAQLHELMRDLVLSPRSIQRGYFRRSALEKIVQLHGSDRTSFYGSLLWNFMALELWHRSLGK
jgi:asparagine synthase (glutamine-hydrolysing)